MVVWTRGSEFQLTNHIDKLVLEKIEHLLLKIGEFNYNLIDVMEKT